MKKCILGVAGIALVAGLLFGGKGMAYLQTAYDKASNAIDNQVPISFQIDAAKKQLENIGPEINDMNHQIAKEKVSIKKLESSIERQEDALETSRREMMTLRSHVESGDEFYVAANSKAYTTTRVKEELRTRLSIHKTATATLEKDQKVLELREKALNAAMERLAEARAQKTELALQIEHLNAESSGDRVFLHLEFEVADEDQSRAEQLRAATDHQVGTRFVQVERDGLLALAGVLRGPQRHGRAQRGGDAGEIDLRDVGEVLLAQVQRHQVDRVDE